MLRNAAQRFARATARAGAANPAGFGLGSGSAGAAAPRAPWGGWSKGRSWDRPSWGNTIRQYGTASEGGAAEAAKETSRPSNRQLRTLFVHSAVPFVAFGFVDNSVLIHAGDAIDQTFGVYFALPTLAAAAIGQVFSDTTGVLCGSYIEALATRLGLPVPELSTAQRSLRITKVVGTMGSVVGVIFGCCLGMLNLLLIDLGASERQRREEELKTIFQTIMQQGHQIAECEKATLFIMDRSKQELWSVCESDEHIIRLSVGEGIAGHVAKSKQLEHVRVPYEDPRFYPEVDRITGFVTRNLMAAPVLNEAGEVVAVVEFLNKNGDGLFTEADEKLLRLMCSHVLCFMANIDRQS